jgi:hypothetical protein
VFPKENPKAGNHFRPYSESLPTPPCLSSPKGTPCVTIYQLSTERLKKFLKGKLFLAPKTRDYTLETKNFLAE